MCTGYGTKGVDQTIDADTGRAAYTFERLRDRWKIGPSLLPPFPIFR